MKFEIDAPVLNENLIRKAGRIHWFQAYAYLAAASVCLMLGVAAFLTQPIGDLRLSLGCIVALLSIPVAGRAAFCADKAGRCTPITDDLCLDALKLTEKHPELEAYRQNVVRARPLMTGDYYAMLDFSNGNPMRAARKALHKLN